MAQSQITNRTLGMFIGSIWGERNNPKIRVVYWLFVTRVKFRFSKIQIHILFVKNKIHMPMFICI